MDSSIAVNKNARIFFISGFSFSSLFCVVCVVAVYAFAGLHAYDGLWSDAAAAMRFACLKRKRQVPDCKLIIVTALNYFRYSS